MPVDHVERAYRAWPKLIGAAKERSPITYRELAQALDIHHRPVRYVLDVIQNYCISEHLPPLTISVVNQAQGMPGNGFIAWYSEELVSPLGVKPALLAS